MIALAQDWRDAADGAAWIGALTPVATPRGPVEAGRLRAGDVVLCCEGHRRVRSVRQAAMPLGDVVAPVLLRAPYFARCSDLVVSPDQPVVLHGAVVEYLFGEDAVLAEARQLVDGRTALPVADIGAVTDCALVPGQVGAGRAGAVILALDRGGSVLADSCALAMPGPQGNRPRLLCAYEAAAYLSHRWDGNLGCVA